MEVIRGEVEEEVAEEFPRLALWSLSADATFGKSSRLLRERLADVGDRARGIALGSLRTDSVTAAYRAFARQIGLDPDVERNPLEQAAFERLATGGFASRDRLRDALLIGMLETGVPLWLLDARHVRSSMRIARDDAARLVVRDERRVLASLMCEPDAELAPTKQTRRVLVYALRVGTVPHPTVHEALWHVRSILEIES